MQSLQDTCVLETFLAIAFCPTGMVIPILLFVSSNPLWQYDITFYHVGGWRFSQLLKYRMDMHLAFSCGNPHYLLGFAMVQVVLAAREHKRVSKELEASRQVSWDYITYERVYLERQLGQNASQGNLVSVRSNEAVNYW